jgi:phage putative head morphogenesis protein, SPP1 gp7 family
MDKAEKQADNFDKVYEEAKTYLDKEINKIFDKFQRDYGLSENVARQVLKTMKNKKDLADLRRMLEARPNDPNIQRLLADLDSPAYTYRMKRLERLSADLDLMRSSIYLSEKQGSDDFYGDLMKDSYYKATFDLQQQTGLAYSFSDLPETEIKRLQAFKWTGEGYSDRIWSNTGALASSVKDELLVSLMTGRSVRDTSQAIAERFEVSKGKARRLVRTESAFFHNQMELLSYEDAEITKYKFVAVLDKRTSHICQEHDNKVYETKDAVPGVNYPPLHPWCRSTTIAYDEDADYSKLERRARNPETGKTELVPADMTYNEWYDKHAGKKKRTKAPKKAKRTQTPTKPKETPKKVDPIDVFMNSFSEGLDSNIKTLKNFELNSTSWYNDRIKEYIPFEDIRLASENLKEILENSEPSMRFKSENVDKLLETDRFLNQFETGTSGGSLSPNDRRRATRQLFGSEDDLFKKRDYEKYGYFGNKDFYEDFAYNDKIIGGTDQYGDVIVRFSKDKVMSRTTFTINNSLGPASWGQIVADNPISPHLVGIDESYLMDHIDILKRGKIKSPEALVDELRVRYIEAQFHGDLGLSDVSSVCFTTKPPTNKQILAFRSKGIDVYVREGDKIVKVK